ncbi:MAG TPA: hypothetical protein VFW71_05850, partial [Actinomycetota bacterium]|nr:hypothetical protein [Actinomycetota bacterium]
APVTPAAPPPAPVPSASPATDPVVTPAADPIILTEAPARPAAKAPAGRGGAGRTTPASHTNHGHHHKAGVLHAIGSLLAHLF